MASGDLAKLLLLSALWGGSFLFIRIAAPGVGPLWLVELRVLLAGLTLLALGLIRGKLPPLRPYWRHYALLGAINSALPFLLISTAELHLPASLAATLNATTPLFGALVAALWLGETLTLRKAIGLLVGFSGVIFLVGLGPLPLNSTTLWSASASLLAALAYGTGAVYTRAKLQGSEPYATALYSLLFAALFLLPFMPLAGPISRPSNAVILSILTLALLSTAFAYLLFFSLIASIGPTKTTMVTYLVPVFGMLWGALFLDEPLGTAYLVGFSMILASVALVSRSGKRQVAPTVDG